MWRKHDPALTGLGRYVKYIDFHGNGILGGSLNSESLCLSYDGELRLPSQYFAPGDKRCRSFLSIRVRFGLLALINVRAAPADQPHPIFRACGRQRTATIEAIVISRNSPITLSPPKQKPCNPGSQVRNAVVVRELTDKTNNPATSPGPPMRMQAELHERLRPNVENPVRRANSFLPLISATSLPYSPQHSLPYSRKSGGDPLPLSRAYILLLYVSSERAASSERRARGIGM